MTQGLQRDMCVRTSPHAHAPSQINSYSASELDAMGTAMAGVSGGANGKAPAQAGASGGADGAFAPMQASALARLSSADDAGAAAREGAVAQGAAVRAASSPPMWEPSLALTLASDR